MQNKDGIWNSPKGNPITEEQVEELIMVGISPAYENFMKMYRSVKFTYTAGRHFSFKTEEGRQRDFFKIIDHLNNNLKPM